jgi:hypothetical protein
MPKSGGLLPETIKIGAIVSAIGAAYKISEFLLKTRRLYGVESENAVLERLLLRVQRDLAETRRLLSLPVITAALQRSPAKADWVYGVVNDTIAALRAVEEYTQHVSKDTKEGRGAGLRNRVMWVLEEKDAILHRQMELATCHLSLTQVMVLISRIERGGEVDDRAQWPRESSVSAAVPRAGNHSYGHDEDGRRQPQWSKEAQTRYEYGARGDGLQYLGDEDDEYNVSYARTRLPRDSKL